MVKDYYLILGVPLDAAPEEIRSAFRKLALQYHPDQLREAEAARFREISEAYEVLSDPVRRARYDRGLRRSPARPIGADTRAPAAEPEPLISEPVPITGVPESARPSFDALFDRLKRNFFVSDVPEKFSSIATRFLGRHIENIARVDISGY